MRFHLSRRQHLQIAGMLWMMVGVMLIVRGTIWVTSWVMKGHHPQWLLAAILPLAALVGVLKGVAVLRKSATKSAERIHLLAERTPIWQLYSPSTYLLVLGMMGLGFLCRWAGAHWHIVGFVGILYLIIGVGLITGSFAYWQARKCLS